MDTLKEFIAPKTLNKLSYVAVICWILFGVVLLGIFADMENSESRFDFSCGGAETKDINLVNGKCFEKYDEMFNKSGIPVYGFVIVNFSLIGAVCVIYSQIVRSTVDKLRRGDQMNGDTERQLLQPPDPEEPKRKRKLFIAYCCQLFVRLALRILFMVLQTQLLYPSNFPSTFNCYLPSGGNQASASNSSISDAIQNSRQTLHECEDNRATKKTFWMYILLVANGVFSLLILFEICVLLFKRKGIISEHLKLPQKQEGIDDGNYVDAPPNPIEGKGDYDDGYPPIHRNNNPFVVRIFSETAKAKSCKTCKVDFRRQKGRGLPSELVLEHKERYYFPEDGKNWKKLIATKNKEASRFYHPNLKKCLKPRFPDISSDDIQIPHDTRPMLHESHKELLRREFKIDI